MMIKLFPWRSLGVTWFEFAKSTVNENDRSFPVYSDKKLTHPRGDLSYQKLNSLTQGEPIQANDDDD